MRLFHRSLTASALGLISVLQVVSAQAGSDRPVMLAMDNMGSMQQSPSGTAQPNQGSAGMSGMPGGQSGSGTMPGQGGQMGGMGMMDNKMQRMQQNPMGSMPQVSSSQMGGTSPGSGQMGGMGMMGMMNDHMQRMQQGMSGGGMGGAMPGMTPGGVDMTDRIDGRIAFLRAELRIRDDQAAAWNQFADALRSGRQHLIEARQLLAAPAAGTTATVRLEQYERHLGARLEAIKASRSSFTQLYAGLDEHQKHVAEELVVPFLATF